MRLALCQEGGRWIGHLSHAFLLHVEDADLMRRAETVFHAAQEAIGMEAVTFKIEDSVDHMLQDFGTGNVALLGDMPDEKGCNTSTIGKACEPCRRLPHLTH